MTTTTERSEITLSPSKYGNSLVRIEQDTDIVLVDYEDVEEFVAAVRKHAGIVEEPEPFPHITAGGEDLRMTRISAKVNIQQKRRDVAYEEGRISVLNSILGD